MTDDTAALDAEIARRFRQRMKGVYIAVVAALLFSVGVVFSLPMMHEAGLSTAEGRIVAVTTDPQTGETLMTSEFADATGTRHRDTETAGYHYAPGEPEVGQRIDYAYKWHATGDLSAFPRADGLLRWVFAVPTALFVAMTGLLLWIVLRQRNLRRRLARHGRREAGQAPRIRHRTLVLPTGNSVHAMQMWRLEARYFEPTRAEFVECHSDWEGPPAPVLADGAPLPVILVDPGNPKRCWLPLGPLLPP
jgi:hypothetical protein